jgi:putative ABC transport system permease protein
MLKHYLSLALRNFAKAPTTALITVSTLALGLISFVAATAVVEFWDRADRHFANSDRTFVATTELVFRDDDGSPGVVPRSAYWLAQYLLADFPQIERVARINPLNATIAVSNGRDRAARLRGYAADADLLAIFDLPFVAGDARTALQTPASVILTREAAATLFGDEAALGQRVVLGGNLEATVTGVIGEIPEPSHLGRSFSAPLPLDLIASRDVYETFIDDGGGAGIAQTPENWLLLPVHTYVLLREGAAVETLRPELPRFLSRHVPPEQIRNADYRLGFIPVGDLLGFSASGASFVRGTGLSASQLLLAIGALVLLAACLNYANLAIARSAIRAREVGIRKAIGASNRQIVVQHVFEAGLSTTVALLLAIVVVWLAAPLLEAASGIDLRSVLRDPRSWGLLLAVDAVVTVLAAGYPAFVLSKIPPDTILRGRIGGANPRLLATVLVAGQFAAASFLVIVMAVTYLQNLELARGGIDASSDPLVAVLNETSSTGIDDGALRDELLRIPEIAAATSMLRPPWLEPSYIGLGRTPEGAGERGALFFPVGYDFFSTYGIPLLAGREFAARYSDEARAFRFDAPPSASTRPAIMVVDRAYAQQLGFATPEAAIDQLVYAPGGGLPGAASTPFEIVGVVENRPLSLTSDGPRGSAYVFASPLPYHVVRISASGLERGVASIDALLRERAPAAPINRRFVDDYFRDGYRTYTRVNQTFALLSGAALLIAIMGLFGMAVHMTSRRLREIGVRKTLGATTAAITRLLVWSLSKPILIGALLSWPLAHVAITRYLNVFVDPIDPSPLLYVFALALVGGVGWIVIGSQTVRAATKAPSEVLRHG